MLFFFLYILVFSPFKGRAVEDILSTRSLKELHHTLQKKQTQRLVKTRCQLQLKNGRLPASCYRWMSFLTQIRPGSRQEFQKHLDEKCHKALRTLKSPEEATLLLQTRGLSPFCEKKLREKAQILIYQLRDQSVQDFLKWHLKQKDFKKRLDFPPF